MSGPVSTWMGDRLGTLGAVGIFFLFCQEVSPHKAQLLLSFNLSGFSFLSDEWKHILDFGLDLVVAMCSGYNVNGFVHR